MPCGHLVVSTNNIINFFMAEQAPTINAVPEAEKKADVVVPVEHTATAVEVPKKKRGRPKKTAPKVETPVRSPQ